MSTYLIVTVALLIVGAFEIVKGLKGRRVGDAPVCAQCEYTLTGIHQGEKCPECGAVVDESSIVRGHRRRRIGLCVLGGLMFGVGLCLLSVSLAPGKLFPYLPTRVVVFLVGQGNDLAFKEVKSRAGAGSMKKSDYRELARVSLDRLSPGAEVSPSNRKWYDLLNGLYRTGDLTQAEQERLYEWVAASIVFDIPKEAGPEEQIRLQVKCRVGLPSRFNLPISLDGTCLVLESVEIDGRRLDKSEYNVRGELGWGHGDKVTCTLNSPLEPGPHEIEIGVDLVVPGTVKWTKHVSRKSSIQVSSTPIANPANQTETISADDLRSRIKVQPLIYTYEPNQGMSCLYVNSVLLQLEANLPVGVAFECLAKFDGRSVHLGDLTCKRGSTDVVWYEYEDESQDWPEIQKVDVVLEPSDSLARKRGIRRFFPHQIELGKFLIGRDLELSEKYRKWLKQKGVGG